MRKLILPTALAAVLAAVGYRHQLELGLFIERFTHQKSPVRHAAAVHLAALPDGLGRFPLEKKAIGGPEAQNLILVTLDGLRWQELFGGADPLLINDPGPSGDTAALRRRFWAESPDDRRRRLFPFFWGKLAPGGTALGNRWSGSRCEVANTHWFSYPGYAEMLCGLVDNRINSNRKVPNPYPTVLEFLNQQEGIAGHVAAFASWDVFTSIYSGGSSGLHIDAPAEGTANGPDGQPASPWPGVRGDAETFGRALAFLKKERPRLLAIHLDGTDDSAHDGRYDHYLGYAHQADGFLKTLWEQLQSDPFYKGKTTLLMTCDHGRGGARGGKWRSHGRSVKGSNEAWMFATGPGTPASGEVNWDHETVFLKQVASTVAAMFGHCFQPDDPTAGAPIGLFFKNAELLAREEIRAREGFRPETPR